MEGVGRALARRVKSTGAEVMSAKKRRTIKSRARNMRANRRWRVIESATGAAVGDAIYRNAKIYGSLHDSFFHYFQQDRELAIDYIKLCLPEIAERLDFTKFEVHPKDFFMSSLQKRSVDLICTAPLKDGSGTVPLALILEHKAQSSPLENAATLAQTLLYVMLHCHELIRNHSGVQLSAPILQPIPIVIYTGSDDALDKLSWRDYYFLPSPFESRLFEIEVRLLNMTQLCRSSRLDSSPFLRAAYDLMTLSSHGKLDGAESTVLTPLSEIENWESRERNLLVAMVCYYLRSALNAEIQVEPSTLDKLLQGANQGKDETMKSVWAEIGKEMRKNERTRIRREGVEEGIGIGREEGLRTAIDQTIETRFSRRSQTLVDLISRICDVGLLKQINGYALGVATSLDDVERYVVGLK